MRNEKAEKGEKQEKGQQTEKNEKGEFGFVGFLIAGLVVVAIGVIAFLGVAGVFSGVYADWGGPLTLLVVGIAIIIVGIYVATMAKRRYPPPK
jgi:amino acid transporter